MGRLRAINERKCTMDNCNRRHYAKGLCKQHYWPAWKAGQKNESDSDTSRQDHSQKSLRIVTEFI
ncbi:hypothetical protein J2Z70_006594 [Paenibacillus silagei]|uniref:HNH endonuclease n=1 Tax=Paenibacillus silagei TaxID=1670801 RepID=A0ABS4P3T0_9BACL|nr:hypothetical protein [Paenibacillus silagei]